MLNEETYNRLEKMFVWDRVFEQTNGYYSDLAGALKKNGITLRARTIDGSSVIQVKAHKNAGSALQISEESEYKTDNIPEQLSAGEVKEMTGLEVPASLLGSLTTKRHSLMYADGVEICLDKNDYLDKTDYEIEIEYTRDIPTELLERLKAEGICFDTAATGKCSRFMMRLAGIIREEE